MRIMHARMRYDRGVAEPEKQPNSANPKLDVFHSYIAAIEGSLGARLFRREFYIIDGECVDVLQDGDLSCATFVTSVLYLFNLITRRHTTVNGTVDDLMASGWYEIQKPKQGAIILWGFKKKDDGTQGKHRHVGFYIDTETAISNSSEARVPVRHHPTYGAFPGGEPQRDVLAYYWHPKLDINPG